MMTLSEVYRQEDVQQRWADLPQDRRTRLSYRFGHVLERFFARLGLICVCMNCPRVLTYEQYRDAGRCPFCGRDSVATPYEC